jgi:hypothetical protein
MGFGYIANELLSPNSTTDWNNYWILLFVVESLPLYPLSSIRFITELCKALTRCDHNCCHLSGIFYQYLFRLPGMQ